MPVLEKCLNTVFPKEYTDQDRHDLSIINQWETHLKRANRQREVRRAYLSGINSRLVHGGMYVK